MFFSFCEKMLLKTGKIFQEISKKPSCILKEIFKSKVYLCKQGWWVGHQFDECEQMHFMDHPKDRNKILMLNDS